MPERTTRLPITDFVAQPADIASSAQRALPNTMS
jgi:hypothetical protein